MMVLKARRAIDLVMLHIPPEIGSGESDPVLGSMHPPSYSRLYMFMML